VSVESGDSRRESPALRRGLAPLELVLSVPMLLMIMAMMIIVGTAGAWKVRTLANSRQAAARSLWPRDGDNDAKPDSWWPQSATMGYRDGQPSPFDEDPFAAHYVVRGPAISASSGTSLNVDQSRVDPVDGLKEGQASIDRDLPLWRQLPYRNSYDRDTQVFTDEQWQHGTMGQGHTNLRRIPVIYPEYDLGRYAPGSVAAMQSSLMTLMQVYHSDPKLPILDRDDELRSYYGDAYDNNWWGRYDRFNFHPAAGGCATDLRPIVDRLVGRPAQMGQPAQRGQIDGVPCRVTSAFWGMYVDQLDRMDCDDPGRGALITNVRQLEAFSSQLSCPLGPWQDPCQAP
jgi:hypothetical protein